MTSKQTYNGWVNWETWNYNLHFCDGDEIYELGLYHGDDCEYYIKPYSVYDIADYLKDEMEEYYADSEQTIFSSFTESALQEISFDEIALNHYDEYLEAYQEGKDNRQDWKVNYYKKEEPEEVEPVKESFNTLLEGKEAEEYILKRFGVVDKETLQKIYQDTRDSSLAVYFNSGAVFKREEEEVEE